MLTAEDLKKERAPIEVEMVMGARGPNKQRLEKGETYKLEHKFALLLIGSGKAKRSDSAGKPKKSAGGAASS